MIKDSVTSRIQKKQWFFTNAQLIRFGESFRKYTRTETLTDGSVVTIPDWKTIYLKAGVKTSDNRVTYYEENGQRVFHIEKFDEMHRQWRKMIDPQVFGEQKRLEQLSETADEINADEVFKNY